LIVNNLVHSSVLPPAVATPGGESLIVGAGMRDALLLLRRAARSDLPVLLLGETGTGKELAAREVHRASPRADKPFLAINCGAISPSLLESTLFGHERGAFTGADRARAGIFEEANGGSVLLDEVGELSSSAQAALLRVLETKRVTRVGSHKEVAVDVRIIAATHRDLYSMAERGEFRLDFLHRISVIAVELPALRQRREDIEPLARYFLSQGFGAREIHPRAVARLRAYEWPGNVRELRNVIARAAALSAGPCVLESDLPDLALRRAKGVEPRRDAMLRKPAAAAVLALPVDLRAQLRDLERSALLRALEIAGGHQRTAAELLGLPLRTFERRLRALRTNSGNVVR
jgi:DNA-binding NtrC family response regulator